MALELANAQAKCSSKKKEDLAKSEPNTPEIWRIAIPPETTAIRQAEEKARVDRLKCVGNPYCGFLVDLALDMAKNNANSGYAKCVENTAGAKKECDDNAKAAYTRCMEDSQTDQDLKVALVNLVYDRCVANLENQRRLLESR